MKTAAEILVEAVNHLTKGLPKPPARTSQAYNYDYGYHDGANETVVALTTWIDSQGLWPMDSGERRELQELGYLP